MLESTSMTSWLRREDSGAPMTTWKCMPGIPNTSKYMSTPSKKNIMQLNIDAPSMKLQKNQND